MFKLETPFMSMSVVFFIRWLILSIITLNYTLNDSHFKVLVIFNSNFNKLGVIIFILSKFYKKNKFKNPYANKKNKCLPGKLRKQKQ